ncbi:hypothetical protein E6W99_12880 [Metabacillus sediminilitoris]|uniref:Uncharacterized protein n=3 Tax=Metabacillus sediminilitoris TaxID=2567941 RepID=A0A4S4BVQ3_9BACI|nr:hypothetical protein E6W99_12880 [Metabacillus sediminilitoris]
MLRKDETVMDILTDNVAIGRTLGVFAEESSCDEEAEVTFTKEGTVQWVDGAGTNAGEYEENTDNVYTFNLNDLAFTATLDENQSNHN